MIIRLLSAGKSFKGLGRYLSHDADRASTSKRVEWTHTLNLANDTVGEAVNEMLWTYRAADQLKRAAGIRTGSHALKNPVKHISLGWDRSDPQTREHMIETVKAFLDHMGWGDHQAAIVCHNDRHPHVHVMLNAVHPETGRALDDGHEWRRSQRFGLRYEREQGKIFCEQRLLPEDQREPAPTREAWMKLKEAERQFEQAEAGRMVRAPDYFTRRDRVRGEAKEWEALKAYQREDREGFFVDGKQAFRAVRNAVFREVRTEFREEWRGYYQAKRDGMDTDRLADMKADILARQNAELDARRTVACAELRERRDGEYEQLLLNQKQERAELAGRQEHGLRSPHLLGTVYGPADAPTATGREAGEPGEGREHSLENGSTAFQAAARETCQPTPEISLETTERSEPDLFETPSHERTKVRDGLDIAGGLGLGALGAIATIGERLFDGFLGGVPPRPRQPSPDQAKPAVQERKARAAEAQVKAAESQAAEAEQLQAYWQERGRRRGRDRD